MFTLVVFTLVVGAITTGSFQNGFNDLDEFGGGFHIRASASPVSPITDMSGSLRAAAILRRSPSFRVSRSSPSRRARWARLWS